MINITYDNSIPEVRRGYALFRRKYALPRMLPMTVMLLAGLGFGLNFVWVDPSAVFPGYILVAMSAGMLVSLWLRPYTAEKKLVAVIEQMGEERYTARFYDDRIEIDTEIIPKDAEVETIAITKHGVQPVENPEVIAEAEMQITQPETSVIGLTSERLFSVEDRDMFCLFVNRALIYIFPKRCMSAETAEKLGKYFEEKSI